MTRILLVCPEPLGHGQPAGIGVRFLEIARVLKADGHSITVLSPDGGAVPGAQSGTLEPESILRATESADAAIVQGHAANPLFAHGRTIPTVVDLYDPFIVENLHYYGERGSEVFTHDHATLIASLLRGDLFLCASEAQRMFYLGLLLAVGRVNPIAFEADPHLDRILRLAPFGVQAPRARTAVPSSNAVLFGGIYDWYDPIVAIEAVALARQTVPDVTLTFTRHPNPDITPQGKAAEALDLVRRRGYEEFVRFEPWVPYDRRGAFLDRFTLALLTFRQSIETDLSMRTRIYDYLWAGLPVVTSSAPGTDEILRRYDAGSVMAIDEPHAFANEIAAILRDSNRRERMSRGTEQFVRDHQWPLVLAPLREFCLRPAFDPAKEPFAVRLQTPERPPSILDRLKRRIGGAF